MILVLFGPPGSGKGTQAEFLKTEYNFLHFSTGSYLRDLVQSGNYPQLADVLSSGGLISDEDINTLVFEKLRTMINSCCSESGEKNIDKIILDGYPRSVPQAQALIDFCKEEKQDLCIIGIHLDEEVILRRLSSRLNCKACGAPVPVVESDLSQCPFCKSSEFFKRSDDTDSSIVKARIRSYKDVSVSVLEFFKNKNIFMIDGNSDISTVKQKIADVINCVLLKEKI